MIVYIIICITFLVVSILFFRTYNNGTGGPLGSIKKRIQYSLSLLCFVGFVVFLTKAYYYSETEKISN